MHAPIVETDLLTNCPALNDAAAVCLLRTNLRICSLLPRSIVRMMCRDLGSEFVPLAHWLSLQTPGSPDGKAPLWVVRYEEAARNSSCAAGDWIGEALYVGSNTTRPMCDAMLGVLDEAAEAVPFDLAPNVDFVAQIFCLNVTEKRLLHLAVCAELSTFGLSCLNVERPASRLHRALAVAIEVSIDSVATVMQWDSALARSGLFANPFDGTVELSEALALSRFGKLLFRERFSSTAKLFDAILQPLPAPSSQSPLTWPALATEEHAVQALLDAAIASAAPGINILLHGAPGTGKTEFARQIAAHCQGEAYEVPFADTDGREATRAERLAALHTAQCMLGEGHPVVLVLDEAEDVFLTDPLARMFVPDRHAFSKAWMNRLLENNVHPVIWLTNSASGIDPAYLRRFAFTVHFGVPDLPVRQQIAQSHFAGTSVSLQLAALVARREDFSAAQIATCARVVRLMASHTAAGDSIPGDEIALSQLNGQARTMGSLVLEPPRPAPVTFDLAYLHLEGRMQASEIVDAIVRHGAGTVLMSGPAGTGKTEFAGLIAYRLGRELLRVTAADVNRPYFGESEQRIASLFDDCRPAQQILFLDEADAVLGDRTAGMHRASHAITTEFLRRLDSFRGVFLCATNYADAIDSALTRRFVFRLAFKPLCADQREALLFNVLGLVEKVPAGSFSLPEPVRQALGRLEGLTPGDYANVARRFTLLGATPDSTSWVSELEQEWRAKSKGRSGNLMGFV